MIDDKTKEQLKKDNPDALLRILTIKDNDFVVAIPTAKQLRSFNAERDTNSDYATTKLIFDCVKFPDKKSLNDTLNKAPGYMVNIRQQLLELTGSLAEAIVEDNKVIIFHDEEKLEFEIQPLSFAQYKLFEKTMKDNLDKAVDDVIKFGVKSKDVLTEALSKYPGLKNILFAEVIKASEVGANCTIKKL